MIHAQNEKDVLITPPGAIKDNAAFTTNEIDTLGFDFLTVKVMLGATDIAPTALKLRHTDTTGTGYADVTGGNMLTANAPLDTDDNGIFTFYVDLRGLKRFIDLDFTGGDGTAGTYACVLATLSKPYIMPSTAALRGHVQELFVQAV